MYLTVSIYALYQGVCQQEWPSHRHNTKYWYLYLTHRSIHILREVCIVLNINLEICLEGEILHLVSVSSSSDFLIQKTYLLFHTITLTRVLAVILDECYGQQRNTQHGEDTFSASLFLFCCLCAVSIHNSIRKQAPIIEYVQLNAQLLQFLASCVTTMSGESTSHCFELWLFILQMTCCGRQFKKIIKACIPSLHPIPTSLLTITRIRCGVDTCTQITQ